jgi:glycosyltransferase involved in cell wall biosynthesis
MTVHNVKPHEKSRIKNLLNKSVIGLADKYIVHCEENKKLFLEDIRTNKDIFVVPHGVEEIENPSIPKEDLRKKYGLSLNDTVLLFFGNIREYKGLDILIKSLKDIDAKLIIAGKPWTKFEEAKSIDKLKLNDKIKLFLDFNPNEVVAELFKISDLVILPYKEFEAASGAGTVALNFGKPLVVTDVGGLPELVKDKNVITKPNCVEDLTEKIEYALKNLKKLESDSKEIALKFSWKSVAQKTLEVYN